MTEIEKQEIKEMAIKIDELDEMNAENIVCDNAYECKHTYGCLACKKAEALNNAGYRKADDLLTENKRLEKEIAIRERALKNMCQEYEDDFDYDYTKECNNNEPCYLCDVKNRILQARQELEE